ncbi:MAG: hypothetical protein ACRDM7_08225 [Thermoleophilaceae bacterium]
MSALWQMALDQPVFEVAVFYDDRDNPVASEGPSTYTSGEQDAETFARQALRGRRSERPGGFWYATLLRGQVADPIGDGHPLDHCSSRTLDWSRTILAEDGRAREERG